MEAPAELQQDGKPQCFMGWLHVCQPKSAGESLIHLPLYALAQKSSLCLPFLLGVFVKFGFWSIFLKPRASVCLIWKGRITLLCLDCTEQGGLCPVAVCV